MSADWLVPDWPAPAGVRALVTTRSGGVSGGPYANMNLGTHVGDAPGAVKENRARLRKRLPSDPFWLEQVHGCTVADAACGVEMTTADASVAAQRGLVCAVLTADCLPVLFCDRRGQVVGAAHAGWRGLAAGVLEATVARMGVPPSEVIAWLGPAIGPLAFEVGSEVREAFVTRDAAAAEAFRSGPSDGKWFADLYRLARLRLASAGISEVFGGGFCTYSDPRFYSYRRAAVTGRFASLIWADV